MCLKTCRDTEKAENNNNGKLADVCSILCKFTKLGKWALGTYTWHALARAWQIAVWQIHAFLWEGCWSLRQQIPLHFWSLSDYSNAQCHLPKYCSVSQTHAVVMSTLHDSVNRCACALSYIHENDIWRREDICIGNWLWRRRGVRGLSWPMASSLAEASYPACDECEQGYGKASFKLCNTKRRLWTYAVLWHCIPGFET
jgi:hypothetical protein